MKVTKPKAPGVANIHPIHFIEPLKSVPNAPKGPTLPLPPGQFMPPPNTFIPTITVMAMVSQSFIEPPPMNPNASLDEVPPPPPPPPLTLTWMFVGGPPPS
tara:strand:- start:711 stop:1013 length:303 start_codon:yes stop_codon:yes gene_type:complete